MVRVVWGCQFDAIIDVKLRGSDTDSYKYEPMTALLAMWETIKKDKHSKHCHNQRGKIAICSLCVRNSREGSPGRALAIELIHGREKGRTPFASTGWVNGQITIAVLRSYS